MQRYQKMSQIQSMKRRKISLTRNHHRFFFKSQYYVEYHFTLKIDDYKKALERIIETFCPLSASSQLDDSQTANRAFLLPSIIDTEAKEMIRSLGCLLNYIVTFQSHDLMEGDAPSCHIRAFALLQLDNYMMIDRV